MVIFGTTDEAGATTFTVSDSKKSEVEEIGADFVVSKIDELTEAAFRDEPPRPLGPDKRPPRRAARDRRVSKDSAP